eukprot:SAG31_NODE_45115_length_260_cov_0.639752_1_plen_84_part_01
MVPRPWDRRVGYFTTDIEVGGPKQLTSNDQAINCWRLEGGDEQNDDKAEQRTIDFLLDPTTPAVYVEPLRRGVESWNVAFAGN